MVALAAGKAAFLPSPTPSPSIPLWDFVPAVPFGGGDYTAPYAEDPVGQDWGFNDGTGGQALVDAPSIIRATGPISGGVATIETGDNTLDEPIAFELWINGAPSGAAWSFAAAEDGTKYLSGADAVLAPGDVWHIVPVTDAGAGLVRAPRFGVALEEL